MKNIGIKITLLLSLILTSCNSGHLSKSQAETIIKECQEKSGKEIFKTNKYTYGIIEVSDSNSTDFSDIMEKHKKMEKLGMVIISEAKKDTREFGRSKGDVIEVTL